MKKINPISVRFLIAIAEHSPMKNDPEVLDFVEKLKKQNIDDVATVDQIENHNSIDEKFDPFTGERLK